MLAPIVLFTYNRLWHTQQTIEALQKNEFANESDLFIYSDGAKNQNTNSVINKLREYLRTIKGFKSIKIIEREKNWGLANSIIDGVTEVINKHGKVIVLEDDILTSPYYLAFMNKALDFYQNHDKVWHISGYMYPIKNTNLPDTIFLKPTTCWGWATWKENWLQFNKDTSLKSFKFSKKQKYDFNQNNSYNYYNHLLLNKKKKLDTWAIFWYATVYSSSGLSLHPKLSLTQNIGHDNSGSNCLESTQFTVSTLQKEKLVFNSEIIENKNAKNALITFYNKQKPTLFFRILSKIRRLLN